MNNDNFEENSLSPKPTQSSAKHAYDSRRVDELVRRVIVLLDVVHVHGVADQLDLIQLAYKVKQRGLVLDAV
jgi:hypothetical protein